MLYEIIWYALGLVCISAWTLYGYSYFLSDGDEIAEIRRAATRQEVAIETAVIENRIKFGKLYNEIYFLNLKNVALEKRITKLENDKNVTQD